MLFVQAMLNQGVTIIHPHGSAPYSAVQATAQEQGTRTTLGLDITQETTDNYKTTILVLLRCARAIAHKCPGTITAEISNLPDVLLRKDSPYLPPSVSLVEGRLDWCVVPGSAIPPLVRRIELRRVGSDDSLFEVHAVNIDTGEYTTHTGSKAGDVLRIRTAMGTVTLQGITALTTANPTLQIAPAYPYPYKALVDSLKQSPDVAVVIRGVDTSGVNTNIPVEYLGLVAVGLAARGIRKNRIH